MYEVLASKASEFLYACCSFKIWMVGKLFTTPSCLQIVFLDQYFSNMVDAYAINFIEGLIMRAIIFGLLLFGAAQAFARFYNIQQDGQSEFVFGDGWLLTYTKT